MPATHNQKKKKQTAMAANVRPRVQKAFSAFCDKKGFVQVTLLGRLIEWFMSLDDLTRCDLVGLLNQDDRRGATLMILQRMLNDDAAQTDDPASGVEPVEVTDAAVDEANRKELQHSPSANTKARPKPA